VGLDSSRRRLRHEQRADTDKAKLMQQVGVKPGD